MSLFLDDGDVTLYHGDALTVLQTLPAGSVHMCVTSPPFYGLRDYGTGRWEGGNPDCDHIARLSTSALADSVTSTRGGAHKMPEARDHFRDVCGKCGAQRVDQQIGLEETPEQWVASLVAVFREVRRVLRADGTLWLEIGDSYAGSPGGSGGWDGNNKNPDGTARTSRHASERWKNGAPGYKPKDLIGAPWMLAFALRSDGWWLRSDIVWARPNPMPESVTDRPTKSHSYIFLLAKQPRYFFDQEAVREGVTGNAHPRGDGINPKSLQNAPGLGVKQNESYSGAINELVSSRNVRSVWNIATQPYPEAHFATFPEELARRCILAGTSERGCCPECGAPWIRQTEVAYKPSVRWGVGAGKPDRTDGYSHDATRLGATGEGQGPSRDRGGHKAGWVKAPITLGWRPSCDCLRNAERSLPASVHDPVPCVVLDPFVGSGTVPYVARKHGRHSIGIDLSASYLELAGRRLQQLSLFAQPAEPEPPVERAPYRAGFRHGKAYVNQKGVQKNS